MDDAERAALAEDVKVRAAATALACARATLDDAEAALAQVGSKVNGQVRASTDDKRDAVAAAIARDEARQAFEEASRTWYEIL